MSTALGKKFDKILRWARKQSVRPFKLRTKKALQDKNQGEMVEYKDGSEKRYVIYISRSVKTTESAIDILFHEIAHINDVAKNGWGSNHSAEHGDEWGKEYSRIYRDYFEAKEAGRIF